MTDQYGVAHLALNVAPSTELAVTLDTSGNPRLLPHSPTKVFAMPDHDNVFVIDESFAEQAVAKPPAPKKHRTHEPDVPDAAPEVRRPVRLEAGSGEAQWGTLRRIERKE